jgi:transcriptional regulator of acetoin/glycerol metabolism
VLLQLATLTGTPYIAADKTSSILEQEDVMYPRHNLPVSQQARPGILLHTPASGDTISFFSEAGIVQETPTLIKMNMQVILHTLALNNGNQSKTAKMLGISRTTLWRYLKK